MTLAWTLTIRLAVCLAFSYVAYRVGGAYGLGSSLALFGLLLARPLIDLASAVRHMVRAQAWKPVQVLEDVDHRRWIRAADVRRVVGFTASSGVLALTYPGGFCNIGKPAAPHFSDAALLLHLAKENSAKALKFRHWVEKEIAFPARRLRERYGVSEQAAGFEPSEPG